MDILTELLKLVTQCSVAILKFRVDLLLHLGRVLHNYTHDSNYHHIMR